MLLLLRIRMCRVRSVSYLSGRTSQVKSVIMSPREKFNLVASLAAAEVPAYTLVENRDNIRERIVGFKISTERVRIDDRVKRGVKELGDVRILKIVEAVINHPHLGSAALKAMLTGVQVEILRRQADQLLH